MEIWMLQKVVLSHHQQLLIPASIDIVALYQYYQHLVMLETSHNGPNQQIIHSSVSKASQKRV
jgi:hypothetical protein